MLSSKTVTVGARFIAPNPFLILLTAFLWISCSSLSDIAATTLGGDVGATTTDTSTSTTSDSTTISSTGTDDSTDSSSDSSSTGDNSATSDGSGVSDTTTSIESGDSGITDVEIDTDSIDTENSPVVFVPLPEGDDSTTTSTPPSLTLSSNFLVTSQDSDDEAVAQAEADSFEASSTLSITNASYVQRLTQTRERLAFLKPVQNFAENHLPRFVSSFLNSVVGVRFIEPGSNFISTAHADSGACIADSEGEVIATVNADGSLDPTPIPGYNTGDVLSIAYCDPATGTLGTADNDSALTHVVYLGDTPSSSAKVASSNGELFLVDDSGNFLEMNYDPTDDHFTMDASVGGFDEGYSQADAGTPDELDLDEENSGYLFRESGVVSAQTLTDGSFTDMVVSGSSGCTSGVCDSTATCTPSSGCSANNVKVRSGKAYYSTEYTTAQSRGSIQELYNDSSDRIEFINSTTGISPSDTTLKSTKAFDVVMNADASSWDDYLVVFEDGSGNLRLFGRAYESSSSIPLPTVSLTLSDVTTVRDLIIYNAADHAGSAALLYDRRLQLYDYNLNQVTCEEEDTDCTASTASITTGGARDFTADENPVALAVNDAGTLGFVLNQGSDTTSTDDDYVTVVNLTNGAPYPGLTELDDNADGILPLSTFLEGKVLSDFSPTSIHFFTVGDDGYLFVGADHMNLGIVMGPF